MSVSPSLSVALPMTSHYPSRIPPLLPCLLAMTAPFSVAASGEPGPIRPAPDATVAEYALGADELAKVEYADIMCALRAVPGVYLQEEEGFGLRPNIAIQGHNLYRSAQLSLLEDGLPAAPAPYAAPQAVYFPTFRRMTGVTVMGGPASIIAGSRSVAGALDLTSSTIPEAFSGSINAGFNENEFAEVIAKVGDANRRWGWLAETAQLVNHGYKVLESDPGAKTGYALSDYLLRLRMQADPRAALRQSLELKLGHTGQDGWETYLGLTDADFQTNPLSRYAASQRDRLDSSRQLYQASYFLAPAAGNWQLSIVGYRNNFRHGWYKLESVGGTGIATILDDPASYVAEMDWIRGGNSPDDALTLRDHDSDYFSQGLQARIAWHQQLEQMRINWQARVIAHQDQEDRVYTDDGYRMDGNALVLTNAGASAGNAANLVNEGQALAAVLQADISQGAWTVSPVLRVENIRLTREEFALDDPARAEGAINTIKDSVQAVVPGLGAAYRLNDRWHLAAGLHRGFAPPLPGGGAGEEESTNVSAGASYQSDHLSAQVAGFVTDYSHLVATCKDYQVGFCPMDQQTDYGKARISGLMASVGQTIPHVDKIGLAFNWHLRYTYTYEAAFKAEFANIDGALGAIEAGDELPYIPDQQVQVGAGVRRSKWGINLTGNFSSETRTRPGQGSIPVTEGTDASFILDLIADYRVSDALRVYVKIDNMTDEVNVVARRPAGVRPNAPRAFGVGVYYGF